MLRLKKDRNYILVLLTSLKFLHDKHKYFFEKNNREFQGGPGSSEPFLEGKLEILLEKENIEKEKENIVDERI